jgi:acetate---CoA ligase (ADP-forming)
MPSRFSQNGPMHLQGLLRPRSIAVIGASPRSFMGQVAIQNCIQLGYKGEVVPVNPAADTVAGLSVIASIDQLNSPVDLALVQVATSRVLDVVKDAATAGIRNFVIPGGGLTDSGQLAVDLQLGLRELAEDAAINAVGPNCMGVLDMVTGAAPYIGTVPPHVRRGRVGVIAQSGAAAELVVNAGGRVPISTVISTGSEIITGLADYVDFFADDPETDAVIGFIEGFVDPEAFMEAAARFRSVGKQFAVTMVGRSKLAREGIGAHSGKLAPPAKVARAALDQAGVHVADDLDELLAFGEIFSAASLPRGNRLALVTNSGGEGNLLADLAEDSGLTLPALSDETVADLCSRWPNFNARNPLDPWGVDDYTKVYPVVVARAAAEAVDIVMVSQDQQQTSGEHEKQLGLDLARYLAETDRHDVVKILLSPTSQDPDPRITEWCRTHNIVQLRGARSSMSALGKVVSPFAILPRVDPTQLQLSASSRALLEQPEPIAEDQALDLLCTMNVSRPRQTRVANPNEAAAVARGHVGPVVVKGIAQGLWHKTDLGLVEVGLSGDDAVLQSAQRILENARVAGVAVELLVAEHVSGSLDVLIGYKLDDQFGPTIVVGLGGVWTEVLDRADLHVGLLDAAAATSWLPHTQVGQMMAAARGRPLPLTHVCNAIEAVCRIAASGTDVVAIDINPLVLSPSGAVALDAAIHRRRDG